MKKIGRRLTFGIYGCGDTSGIYDCGDTSGIYDCGDTSAEYREQHDVKMEITVESKGRGELFLLDW